MGSSAQNSSGVHWCRRRFRFNRVSEKVPEKVPERVWEALVQSQVRFNRVPKGSGEGSGEGLGGFGAARSGSEKVWEALVQSQVKFNRVREKVPEKVPGSLGAKPSQVVTEKAGRLWCRARWGSTGFRRRFRRGCGRLWWRARQVRFNRVPEKVPEKVWEALVQSQIRFNRVPEKHPEKHPEKVPGSLCAKPSQVQRVPEKVAEAKPGQAHLTRGNPAEVFPALGFAACSERFVKMKRCGCWGYRRSLFLNKVLGRPAWGDRWGLVMTFDGGHHLHWAPSSMDSSWFKKGEVKISVRG